MLSKIKSKVFTSTGGGRICETGLSPSLKIVNVKGGKGVRIEGGEGLLGTHTGEW